MARTSDSHDPKGLIRESFRIEGISAEECRSIFLDWALSLPEDMGNQQALQALLEKYRGEAPDHPMLQVMRQGLTRINGPRRRGGWRGRRQS